MNELDKAIEILVRALDNIAQSMSDDYIQTNARFRSEAGMLARVIRKSSGHCCEWCESIAGTYTYPDVPKEVYQRHDNCDCTVEYDPGDGSRKTIHSGTEGKRKYVKDKYGGYEKTKEARIEHAKQMAESEDARKKAAREKRIATWEKKKKMQQGGAWNGAWNNENDRSYEKRDRIAFDLYSQIINRKKEYEIKAVSNYSGYTYDEVEKIYNHIFVDAHLFEDGSIHKFEPDYYMAHSWIRLRTGKNIQKHDIILLGHELEEKKIIDTGVEIEYEKAHNIANKKYNYEKALLEYLKEHDV